MGAVRGVLWYERTDDFAGDAIAEQRQSEEINVGFRRRSVRRHSFVWYGRNVSHQAPAHQVQRAVMRGPVVARARVAPPSLSAG